jgi:hypothetical protein
MINEHNEYDLDWQAFCYAAGELQPDQVERFELRLAEEQPAREALARAIELTQAVAAAESQVGGELVTPVFPRSNWTTRLAWMAIGGVAALLLAVLSSGSLWPQKPREIAARPDADQQRSLAAAWSEARLEIASARDDGSWPIIAQATADADAETSPLPDSRGEDLALEETPSWMTTAVLGLAGMTPDENEAGEGPFNNE